MEFNSQKNLKSEVSGKQLAAHSGPSSLLSFILSKRNWKLIVQNKRTSYSEQSWINTDIFFSVSVFVDLLATAFLFKSWKYT